MRNTHLLERLLTVPLLVTAGLMVAPPASASLIGTTTVDWSVRATTPDVGSVGRSDITIPHTGSSVLSDIRYTATVLGDSFSLDAENITDEDSIFGPPRDINGIEIDFELRDMNWLPDGGSITGVTVDSGNTLPVNGIDFSEIIGGWRIVVDFNLFDLTTGQSKLASFNIQTDHDDTRAPEPGTALLLGLGLAGLTLGRRKLPAQ